MEIHGTLRGEPFWARLTAADERFGGRRVLQLLYTPPTTEALAGTHLVDHPFLLVDERLRIWAWNERQNGLSGAEFRLDRQPKGYAIALEKSRPLVGGEEVPVEEKRSYDAPAPRWDVHLAPLLVAFSWQPDPAPKAARAMDLFKDHGDADPAVSIVAWQAGQLAIGKTVYSVNADESGRLATIQSAAGQALLEITGWISP
jgi:hypothetical protein